ncbi:MAG: hypothetical protein KME45_16205 [Stenomitos rutilans HA7619-LM2]|jgi:hypothetical protein|nr:hypothetical protein [Stenomitos rutilans HA7619-LM2]
MEHWEFLLQKEGDRSWLPLDSPDVEILEGRYRVVARSRYINAAIDIRIAHLATEAVPPKRRIQKRSCRTNHDGLMVVIPFTHLESGQWELCCSPADLMSDLMAGAQPYALKLQVLAHSLEEDWEPDWVAPTAQPAATSTPTAQGIEPVQSEADPNTGVMNHAAIVGASAADEPLSSSTAASQPVSLPPEVAEILAASMDRLFQIAEQMSDQLVDEVLQDFDLTAIANAPTAASNETAQPTPEPATVAPTSSGDSMAESGEEQSSTGYTLAANETFMLTLDQSAFVAARGEVMTLSGQLAIVSTSESVAGQRLVPSATSPMPTREQGLSDPWESDVALDLLGVTAQEIQLCLRDPQSLQVLVSDRQPLQQQPLPCPFTFFFSLPDAFTTHLVLGEVLLCGTFIGNEATSIALVTQAFSITVDPGALVNELTKLNDALTADIEDEERIDLPLELSSRLKEQATPAIDLSFLSESIVESPVERSPRFPSLAGQPLPPQIYRPAPNQVRAKAPDLPAFKLVASPTVSTDASSANEQVSTEPPTVESAASAAVDVPIDSAEAEYIASDNIQATEEARSDALTNEVGETASSDVNTSVAVDNIDPATEEVPLDLPSPTQMSFQSLKLQDRFLTRLTSLATDAELSALLKANIAPGQASSSPAQSPALAEDRSLSEEIVIDDDSQPTERRRSKPVASTEPEPLDTPPSHLLLPADDPVPTPILEVTTGELTAGKPISIRVKLPDLLPRIYVKLWVIDRQTRSLLDGPRWLVDFLPNGLGELEAMTPLTVPFGSVELRFEAIAVEMHTQRESYKVAVDRIVVPPDLPNVSLDDFHA